MNHFLLDIMAVQNDPFDRTVDFPPSLLRLPAGLKTENGSPSSNGPRVSACLELVNHTFTTHDHGSLPASR